MPLAKNIGQGSVGTAYRTGASDNTGVSSPTGIYIGFVKKTDDNQEMGRLKVYIKEFGGNPDTEESWISVSYASPFAGSTSLFDQGANVTEYSDTIKSYGMWMVPPDLETRVLVAFVNGKIDLGYWFACLFQRGTQVSIPGIAAGKTYDGENIPAAPKNKRDQDPDNRKYVTHKPMYDALRRQGLETDLSRGLSSSSVMRESPSKVMGILTPGQHQFVLDDGDKDGNSRLIRFRTTNGVQLLLDDTAGHIYLVTKNGESWIEISADGQIHLYGSSDINIRSEANINIRADKDVNIEAGNNVNIKAVSDSVKLEAGKDITTLATSDTKITSQGTSNINSQIAHYETAGVIHMNGPAAAPAAAITVNNLVVNQGVTESVCTVVPEHEPWSGHAGSINPVGVGNIQSRKDPAPGQTPRTPVESDTGAQVSMKTPAPAEQMSVKTASCSAAMYSVIKEENGYSPVAVSDAGGASVGYGSELKTSESAAILSQGITVDQAEQMLNNNIAESVSSVKKLLSRVDKIPGNVFDGLVSFHNQTGDASYVYTNNEKIDLRSLLNNKDWGRVAGLIAADDRDRSRRIREAGIMASGNYGKITDSISVVNQGLQKTSELLSKGKLNQQTGTPATAQQLLAASSGYFAQTGKMLPNLSFPAKLNVLNNVNNSAGLLRKTGPWPY